METARPNADTRANVGAPETCARLASSPESGRVPPRDRRPLTLGAA